MSRHADHDATITAAAAVRGRARTAPARQGLSRLADDKEWPRPIPVLRVPAVWTAGALLTE